MALTVPETIGFCEEVAQFMTTNSAALTAKGLTVITWIMSVKGRRNAVIGLVDRLHEATYS